MVVGGTVVVPGRVVVVVRVVVWTLVVFCVVVLRVVVFFFVVVVFCCFCLQVPSTFRALRKVRANWYRPHHGLYGGDPVLGNWRTGSPCSAAVM